MIFDQFANLKYKYGNRHFWYSEYCVDTAGKNTAAIKECIANQLKQDKESGQLSMFDPNDPFKGSKYPMNGKDEQLKKKDERQKVRSFVLLFRH